LIGAIIQKVNYIFLEFLPASVLQPSGLIEIDPATMESRKVKGLYITGELLDIDGYSGSFNL